MWKKNAKHQAKQKPLLKDTEAGFFSRDAALKTLK
jgi:hypothetical protein